MLMKHRLKHLEASAGPAERSHDGQKSAPEGLDLLDRRLAYTLFRLTLGGSLLLHGATRLGADSDTFPLFRLEEPALPPAVALPFAVGMTLLSTGLGLLLTLGLWTRGALIGGAVLVTALVVGNAYRTDWQSLTVQMMYLAMFYLLPSASHYNVFSADALLRRFSVGGQPWRLSTCTSPAAAKSAKSEPAAGN